MGKKFAYSLIVSAIASISAHANPDGAAQIKLAHCEDRLAVWSAERDGERTTIFGAQTPRSYLSDLYFERFKDGRRIWRLKAEIACSQGHSVCRVEVPATGSLDAIGRPSAHAELESIDLNADGNSEFLVLAALGQHLFYMGGADVEWAAGELGDSHDRVLLPNVYQFEGCQRPVSDQEASARQAEFELSRRPLFAKRKVCEAAKANRVFDPDSTEGFDDGIWWTAADRIVGWEYDCRLIQIEEGKAKIHCDMGDYGIWDEDLSWTETHGAIQISRGSSHVTELVRCE